MWENNLFEIDLNIFCVDIVLNLLKIRKRVR